MLPLFILLYICIFHSKCKRREKNNNGEKLNYRCTHFAIWKKPCHVMIELRKLVNARIMAPQAPATATANMSIVFWRRLQTNVILLLLFAVWCQIFLSPFLSLSLSAVIKFHIQFAISTHSDGVCEYRNRLLNSCHVEVDWSERCAVCARPATIAFGGFFLFVYIFICSKKSEMGLNILKRGE